MRVLVTIFSLLCADLQCIAQQSDEGAPEAESRGQEHKVAGLSNTEVGLLKERLAKMTFPLPDFTVERMLPVLVKPEVLANADGFGARDESAWCGGMIADFWLNDDYVVRVTYGYYVTTDDGHTTQVEERAVVLHRTQRGEELNFRPLKERPSKPSGPGPAG